MAAQINRTAKIIQTLLNPGLGLPSRINFTEVNQILHEVDKDLNLALKALPSNVTQDFILVTRRSQNLPTFAVFSLIMAFIMAIILVTGICTQLVLLEEKPTGKAPLPIIKMTSIIDPEDLNAVVLPLVRTDPQRNGTVGETP
jgi:hypothetical protein